MSQSAHVCVRCGQDMLPSVQSIAVEKNSIVIKWVCSCGMTKVKGWWLMDNAPFTVHDTENSAMR